MRPIVLSGTISVPNFIQATVESNRFHAFVITHEKEKNWFEYQAIYIVDERKNIYSCYVHTLYYILIIW